jgi:hypothetical protein
VIVAISTGRPQYDEDESEEQNSVDGRIPLVSDGDKGGVEVKLHAYNSDFEMDLFSNLKVNCVSIPCDTSFDIKTKNNEWKSSYITQAKQDKVDGSASKNETIKTEKRGKKTTDGSTEKSTTGSKDGSTKNLDETVPEDEGLGTSIRGKIFFNYLIKVVQKVRTFLCLSFSKIAFCS